MQDLTLIRDEDTVHMRSRDPQLHPSGASLLETIEDSGTEHLLGHCMRPRMVSQEGSLEPWVSEGSTRL